MKIPNKTNSKLKFFSYVRQNIQSQPMIVKQELTFISSMAKKYTFTIVGYIFLVTFYNGMLSLKDIFNKFTHQSFINTMFLKQHL